jgi:hypothetical protein
MYAILRARPPARIITYAVAASRSVVLELRYVPSLIALILHLDRKGGPNNVGCGQS